MFSTAYDKNIFSNFSNYFKKNFLFTNFNEFNEAENFCEKEEKKLIEVFGFRSSIIHYSLNEIFSDEKNIKIVRKENFEEFDVEQKSFIVSLNNNFIDL